MKRNYTRNDIVDMLRTLGLKEGDCVFSHANIGFFGQLEGASAPEDYGGAFLDAFRTVIGESGTVCVPVFTYSFCRGEFFDLDVTPSAMGLFSEYVRTRENAHRSCDPNFSVAALGRLAAELTENAPAHSFGSSSFWERFLGHDGVICNFNFDAGSTFVHFIEKHNAVPYRFDKAFSGSMRSGDGVRKGVFFHFVRHLDRSDWDTSMPKIDGILKNSGLTRTAHMARGCAIAYSSRQCFDVLSSLIQADPFVLTKGIENE